MVLKLLKSLPPEIKEMHSCNAGSATELILALETSQLGNSAGSDPV